MTINGVTASSAPNVSVTVAGSAPYTACSASAEATVEVVDPVETPEVHILDPQTREEADVACNDAQVLVQAQGIDFERTDYIYTWYKNGVLVPGADGFSFIDQLNNTTNDQILVTYQLVLGSTSGCPSVSSNTVELQVWPPFDLFITGPTQICEGADVELMVNASTLEWYGSFIVSDDYVWYVDEKRRRIRWLL